ncbi:hypothetical protein MKK55_02645 [Methylobacterium sp. J-059]|uniref:hypothetical protein n=1 Tax=Methylobacterium sp. J-059 TaxID=2836643 RepID=UPI001FB88083|nr:hypothetical protein [Methylobacterium sp. J-059]MCJ2037858.1 hypothetical protein [Methylobacterium sp. J-059]
MLKRLEPVTKFLEFCSAAGPYILGALAMTGVTGAAVTAGLATDLLSFADKFGIAGIGCASLAVTLSLLLVGAALTGRAKTGRCRLAYILLSICIFGCLVAAVMIARDWAAAPATAADDKHVLVASQQNSSNSAFDKISVYSTGDKISFSAISRLHLEKVRVLLDFSWRELLGAESWSKVMRVPLLDLHSIYKGQYISEDIAIKSEATHRDIFGSVKYSIGRPNENMSMLAGPNKARIVFVLPDGSEQYCDFLVIVTDDRTGIKPSVVLNAKELDRIQTAD